MASTTKVRTGLLVGATGALVFSAPMLLSLRSSGPVIDQSKPLKPEAVRRGAFNNSGSKDIGPEYVIKNSLSSLAKAQCKAASDKTLTNDESSSVSLNRCN